MQKKRKKKIVQERCDRFTDKQLENRGITKVASNEVFVKLDDCPLYFISNYGQIYSTVKKGLMSLDQKPGKNGNVYLKKELVCKPYIDKNGVRRTTKSYYIHHLVYKTFCDDSLYKLRQEEDNTEWWNIHHADHNSLNNAWYNLVKLPNTAHRVADDIKGLKIAKTDYSNVENARAMHVLMSDVMAVTDYPLDAILYELSKQRAVDKQRMGTEPVQTVIEVCNDQGNFFTIWCNWITKNKDGTNRKLRFDRKIAC